MKVMVALGAVVCFLAWGCGHGGDTQQVGTGGSGGSSGGGSAGGASSQGGSASGSGGSASGSGGSASGSGGSASGSGGQAGGGAGSAGDESGGMSGAVGSGGDPVGGTAGQGGSAGSAGQGGSAGSAGHGGLACVVDADCNDGDPTTADFDNPNIHACGNYNPVGAGWVTYGTIDGDGFGYDVATGLSWAVVTGSRIQPDAGSACSGLSRLELDDWRLPSIDEARSLAGGCADTAPGGTCALDDPSCLSLSCGTDALCSSCGSNQGPHDGEYCRAEVAICEMFHTNSQCSDCAVPATWGYSVISGNFVGVQYSSMLATVCVMAGIQNAGPECLD